jgi:dolichol-phosphate mannosyltransferase
MRYSIVIPLHNEASGMSAVISDITAELKKEKIPYELVLVNDNSTDATLAIANKISEADDQVKVVSCSPPNGFGRAIKFGLDHITGDAVAIVMGDGSDTPKDVVRYYRKLQEGYDCVFGSRFIRGSKVNDYPLVKLIFNRIGNFCIKYLFGIACNDISNAFKAYRRGVIESVKPLVSNHFNITVEIPLKAVVRGYKYTVIPIDWLGRTSGVSKHNLKELQKKYFFSILYVLLEKILLADEVVSHKKK